MFSQKSISKIDSLLQSAMETEVISPLKAQSQAREVLAISKENHYTEGEVGAAIFLSESYTRSKDHELALFYAKAAAEKIQDLDVDLKSKVLRIKAISLGRMGFSDEAIKFLGEAVNYAEKIEIADNRNESLGYIYANFAENYRDNDIEKDSVGYYYRKSFYFFDKIVLSNKDRAKHLAFAYVNLATLNLKERKFEEAKLLYEQALERSKTHKLDFIIIEALSGLGSINYYQNDFKQAKVYFNDALVLARSKKRVFYINDLYYNLLRTYKNLNQKDSSDYYKEKYLSLNDSLAKSNKESMAYSLKLFLEEKEKKTTSKVSVIVLYIGIVIIVACVVFVYMLFYNRRLRNLKNEVQKMDNQLVKKHELIQKILIKKENTEAEINELINLAMTGNPSFYNKFKETHSDFIENIIKIAPDIILSELRFCALIKLGFSTVEIATCTKSTVRAVESRKYRLRKKIPIPVEVDLNDWLKSL